MYGILKHQKIKKEISFFSQTICNTGKGLGMKLFFQKWSKNLYFKYFFIILILFEKTQKMR